MPTQHIHIVGIGGSGASGVARYLQTIGFTVSGSDNEPARTAGLKQLGMTIADTHAAANVVGADLVLVSPGLYEAKSEVAAARRRGMPVSTWQAFLGRYLQQRPGRGFMVAGTYGKGSTAAILSHILAAAYLDPLVILGVEDLAWGSNLRPGFGGCWVLEADEYDRHFHAFRPAYALLTSLEHEHVTTYPTFEAEIEAFRTFFGQLKDPAGLATRIDAASPEVLARVLPAGAVTYSASDPTADVYASDVEPTLSGSRFVLHAPRWQLADQPLEVRVPGRIHVENAVGAAALALAAGLDQAAVNAGLATFRGLRRRFEVVRHGAQVTIFDYAHTPERMQPVIDDARSLFPGMRMVVVFEPHLYSRTEQFRQGFQAVLRRADRAYVTDIYPAREAGSKLGQRVHSRQLVREGDDRVSYVGSLQDGIAAVAAARTERDVVLVLGAGPIQQVGERLTAAG